MLGRVFELRAVHVAEAGEWFSLLLGLIAKARGDVMQPSDDAATRPRFRVRPQAVSYDAPLDGGDVELPREGLRRRMSQSLGSAGHALAGESNTDEDVVLPPPKSATVLAKPSFRAAALAPEEARPPVPPRDPAAVPSRLSDVSVFEDETQHYVRPESWRKQQREAEQRMLQRKLTRDKQQPPPRPGSNESAAMASDKAAASKPDVESNYETIQLIDPPVYGASPDGKNQLVNDFLTQRQSVDFDISRINSARPPVDRSQKARPATITEPPPPLLPRQLSGDLNALPLPPKASPYTKLTVPLDASAEAPPPRPPRPQSEPDPPPRPPRPPRADAMDEPPSEPVPQPADLTRCSSLVQHPSKPQLPPATPGSASVAAETGGLSATNPFLDEE